MGAMTAASLSQLRHVWSECFYMLCPNSRAASSAKSNVCIERVICPP